MSDSIICGGKLIHVPGAEVRTWRDTGLTFDLSHAPRRTQPARWCVLHWTGSEREGPEGAAAIHRTLTARGLSVEFAITNEGTVWQFLDPLERRGRHCSRMNAYSVGVEVSGIGWAGKPGRKLTGWAAMRDVYRGTVHGWATRWLDYLPAQHAAMSGLAEALIAGLGLERRVELGPFERRSDAYLEEHGGFCGHLHGAWLTKRHPKCDPGPRPLETLAGLLGC